MDCARARSTFELMREETSERPSSPSDSGVGGGSGVTVLWETAAAAAATAAADTAAAAAAAPHAAAAHAAAAAARGRLPSSQRVRAWKS
mmetsp:Transcript_42233/g.104664  ORF Transcript_42233/g.104664 Transcript_42233/m.104664 type:complete len:89 (-) Transcript_42233:916-1182(-)